MTKVDIISGFLGAGKTTLIKKLIKEAYGDEQIVLIENEFGEIGIDGGFLKDAGIEIKEMNSGCICCSLVGDFASSLEKVIQEYHPDRILIEPSGVGKLSDVVKAVIDLHDDTLQLNSLTTVVDGNKCRIYMKNFGEFFNNQVETAQTIIVSRTQMLQPDKLAQVVESIQKQNEKANLITTPWDEINGKQILEVMEKTHDMEKELLEELAVCPVCHHHHDHEECDHEHHHEHEECGCEHHHEHHHNHEGCGCEHHHEHEECSCGHHHEDHHHHHADDIFTSWGKETIHTYEEATLHTILTKLSQNVKYGTILRAKGMVQAPDQTWLTFDFVPEEFEIRKGNPATIGKLCVIGTDIKEDALSSLFQWKEEE